MLIGIAVLVNYKGNKMLKRTISGAVYVAIIVGFFLLREFVDFRLFNILTCFFTVVGAFELARALKPYSLKGTFLATVIFGAIFVPLYCLTEYVLLSGWGWIVALDLSVAMILAFAIYAIVVNADFKMFGVSVLGFIYPALLMLTTLLANDLSANGFIALLLIFVIAPCSDTMAYLVGMTYSKIRKGQAKKLCPKLSPKKTWAGAIGGIVGGALGALIIYFICKPSVNFFSPILLFIIVGLVSSVLTEIGDLFESYIKRKAGIKDSGKIMPGHGGVLDRIDGMSFVSVFVYLVFLFV